MIQLSIIIPHYNDVLSLNKLIKTIPRSEEIEIIVIDDKSNKFNEEYNKIRKKFTYVKFFGNNSEKKGAGACRNIGLNNASGKWLLFADADDYFTENFYEKVEKYFESDSDIVFFSPISIENDTGNISDRHIEFEKLIEQYIVNENEESELHLRYRWAVPWSKLIKNEVVKKENIMFTESIVSNDVIFSTKVGFFSREILVSKETIYCVTRNRGSLTTLVDKNKLNIRLEIFVENYKFIREVLSPREMKLLNTKGTGYLVDAIIYKTGIKNIIRTYIKLFTNRIPVLSSYLKNPKAIIKKIYERKTKYQMIHRFLSR